MIDHGIKKGASRAHLFTCDDEHDYIVKFYELNQGKTAINELVGGAIAMTMNLPTPPMVLVHVSEQIISHSPELQSRGIRDGLHME